MRLDQLVSALESGGVKGLNIITHSRLNRYAVQLLMRGAAPGMLTGRQRWPCFRLSSAQLPASLQQQRIAPRGLQVTVAQDEMTGR